MTVEPSPEFVALCPRSWYAVVLELTGVSEQDTAIGSVQLERLPVLLLVLRLLVETPPWLFVRLLLP